MGISISFGYFYISNFFYDHTSKAKPQDTRRYSIYSSKPLTLQTATTSIYSKDSRAQKINAVYKKYNCPLEGMGDVLVYEADKNNIPWWLVAAVSFQESGCGKVTPKVGGKESYNAWGWEYTEMLLLHLKIG